MFCDKCGKPMDENMKVCTNCGAENTYAEAASAENVATPDTGNSAVPESDANVEKTIAPGGEEPPKPKKKKGKKKALVAAIIAVVLVAAVAISAFASPFVGNLLAKTFLPADKYLGYVIKNSTGAVAEGFSANRAVLKEATSLMTKSQRSEGDIELTAGDGLKTLLEDGTGMDMSWVSSVGIGMEVATDGGDLYGVKGNVRLNGTEITKADVAMDLDAGMVYVSLPDISDKAVGTELPYYYTYMLDEQDAVMDVLDRLVDAIPDEKVLKKMLGRYAEQVVLQIKDVEKNSEELTAGEVTQSVTVLTADISEKTLIDIAMAVCEEAKDDEEIENIIRDVAEIEEFGLDADEVYEEFKDAIDDFLEESEEYDADRETIFALKFWVNSNGIIIGCGVETDDTEVEFYTLEKGKNFGTVLKVETENESFIFEGGGKSEGGKQNATYAAKLDGKELLTVKISDIDDGKLQKSLLDGTVSLVPGEGLLDGMDYELADVLRGARLDLVFRQETASDAEMEIAAYTDNELFASLKIIAKQDDNGKVDLPATYVNADNEGQMEAWLADADFQVIVDRLRAAGLPGELADLLEVFTNPGVEVQEEDAVVDPLAIGTGTVIQ